MKIKLRATVKSLLLIGLMNDPLHADLPAMTDEERKEHADVIVTGNIRKVYTEIEIDDRSKDVRFMSELAVTEVEKGDGIDSGHAIFIESSYQVERDPDAIGARGTIPPAVGSSIRAYLRHNSGRYRFLAPNGIDWLDSKRENYPLTAKLRADANAAGRRVQLWWIPAALVGGFICGHFVPRGRRSGDIPNAS